MYLKTISFMLSCASVISSVYASDIQDFQDSTEGQVKATVTKWKTNPAEQNDFLSQNTDVLREIVKYLEVNDYMALAKTSKTHYDLLVKELSDASSWKDKLSPALQKIAKNESLPYQYVFLRYQNNPPLFVMEFEPYGSMPQLEKVHVSFNYGSETLLEDPASGMMVPIIPSLSKHFTVPKGNVLALTLRDFSEIKKEDLSTIRNVFFNYNPLKISSNSYLTVDTEGKYVFNKQKLSLYSSTTSNGCAAIPSYSSITLKPIKPEKQLEFRLPPKVNTVMVEIDGIVGDMGGGSIEGRSPTDAERQQLAADYPDEKDVDWNDPALTVIDTTPFYKQVTYINPRSE